MLRSTIVLLFACTLSTLASAQKGRFHHRISQQVLDRLKGGTPSVLLSPKHQLCVQEYRNKNGSQVHTLSNPVLKGVVTRDKDKLLVDFWSIVHKPASLDHREQDYCHGSATVINSNDPPDFSFQLPARAALKDPTVRVRIPFRSWVYGVNSIGIKWRGRVTSVDQTDSTKTVNNGPNVQTGNINLGFTLGRSFGWTKFTHRSTNNVSITPALALGFSSTTLAKEPLSRKADVTNLSANLVLSPAMSMIVARNDVGLIFSYGWDFMTGQGSSVWAYNGRPWFGLGVSASLKI